jgi:hypothetical protein
MIAERIDAWRTFDGVAHDSEQVARLHAENKAIERVASASPEDLRASLDRPGTPLAKAILVLGAFIGERAAKGLRP